MQTVITRYLSPTHTRGARIKVISGWGSKTYSYDHGASCAHSEAFGLFLAEQNKIMAEKYPDHYETHGDWWQLVACADSLDGRGLTFIIK